MAGGWNQEGKKWANSVSFCYWHCLQKQLSPPPLWPIGGWAD